METKETGKWSCKMRLEKREGDIDTFKTDEEKLRFLEQVKPYEVIEREGNLLLVSGINEIWHLITGHLTGAARLFSNANAKIGVGNSTLAAVNTQIDLQGASKTYVGQQSGFPSFAARTVKFRSSFGGIAGNHVWAEWVVKSASSVAPTNICLNRKVEALGTKTGGTWTLEVSISLS